MTADSKGRVMRVNPAAIKMLGYKNEKELLGIPVTKFYENPQKREKLLKELLRKGCVETEGEITSSFSQELKMKSRKLSAREIEICHLIKSGLSGKEIGNLLNISFQTVETHRKNIRTKMGISKKDINLATFLRELRD